MKKRTFFKKIKKSLTSIAVLSLLLPNIVSVGVVAAEELNSDEPQTENIENITTDEENLEIETNADEDSEEPTVEENETPPTPEPEEPVNEEELVEETSETPNVTQEDITEDAPVTIEETPLDTFTPTQVEEDQLGEPTEVNTHILVRAPNNMNSYSNTLNDFETHPLILTNQVTDETFSTTIRPDDGNTSNHFTLETTVHAYERGNEPSGRYTITLPQELIDLGYSLTRNHSVQSNFAIVGTTNLSYNAPQPSESVGQLSKNASDYDYLVGRDLGITLTTLDGQRTYSLGNTNLNIPSGEYNIRITNTPTDSRPQFIHRDSSLVNAPEREIELTQDGNAYVGTITLDFTNSTSTQIFKLSPIPVEGPHTVTIDPNGGTINNEYLQTEVIEEESYSLPLRSRAGLEIPGYTLVGFEVTEGILLDTEGNPLSEIPTSTSRNYTLESDVTLSAIWEETTGGFRVQLYDDVPSTQRERYTLTLMAEDGTEYELSSNQSGPGHRTWTVDDVPNGTYTLVIDGYNISEAEKFGQNDTTSDFVVNEDGTATVELEFVDNKSTTFIRYRVYGELVPETNTVTIDPNGGTIDDAYATTEVTEGETYTVPYTFQSDLARAGYTLTGYTVEGTLLDANGEPVTELSKYTGIYTPESDVTLTANWEVTAGKFTVQLFDEIPSTQPERYTLKLIADDNTEFPLSSNSYNANRRVWEAENVPNGTYTLAIEGFNIDSGDKLGQPDTTSKFVVNDNGTATVELEFVDDKSTSFIRYQVYGEPIPDTNTVAIDPNGGTIDEAYATMEVTEGDTYTVPYTFQSNLARAGYTLIGYTVEGRLLDANGELITELSKYTGTYTPESDVTLTANWEVTSGGFRIQLYDSNPSTQLERYTMTLIAEDGTEYEVPSRQYNSSFRTWSVDGIPNGTYTLEIDGFIISEGEKFGQPDTTSDFVVNEDGTATVELEFVDDKSTTFIRYQVYGEPIPDTNTVTIDPNGGTINETYASKEVTEGETYTVPYTFQSNLARPGYTLTGYTVEGTLLDSNGNEVTELSRYTGVYTPMSDVTLTANWEVTSGGFRVQLYDSSPSTQLERYTMTLIAEDGTEYVLFSNQYGAEHRTWRVDDVPNGSYTLVIDGYRISEGEKFGQPDTTSDFVVNEDGTATVELEFVDDKSTSFIRYQVYGDPIPETNTVTIDPNGGTIDDSYATTEVTEGETYTVPYTFQSDLARAGYTLTGYTVEGRLLDANGELVTELSKYTGIYTPESDVTLTANWEITSGGFRIQLYDDAPSTQRERYTLTLIAEDGTEYVLSSNQYGAGHRTWKVEDVPNGTYTLAIDGYNISEAEKFGQNDTTSDFVVNDDGTATVELEFVDDKSTTFIRYKVYGEPVPEEPTVPDPDPEDPTDPDDPDPTDPEKPTDPEEPTDPDPDPEEPTDPDDPDPTDPEKPTDPEEPTNPEKPADAEDSSSDLPLTGVATSAVIGLGITSILSGLGLFAINKKREDE